MYYFDIIDILEKHKRLSSSQIKLKIIQLRGNCNRNSYTKALRKLLDQDIIGFERDKIEGCHNPVNFYFLKKHYKTLN